MGRKEDSTVFGIYLYINIFILLLLTFINTDSLNFSRFIILMATFLPVTQCTPNLTRPRKKREKKVKNNFIVKLKFLEAAAKRRFNFPKIPNGRGNKCVNYIYG